MNHRATIHSILAGILLGAAIQVNANEDNAMDAFQAWIEAHTGTDRSGTNELWVDPTGDETEHSDATLMIESDAIIYTWSYKGKPQTGELRWADGLRWKDSWHQPDGVTLEPVRDHGALLAGEYSYPAGSGPDWHWRVKLSQRPDDTIVMQMTNIAPWGEEARAVRMMLPDPG